MWCIEICVIFWRFFTHIFVQPIHVMYWNRCSSSVSMRSFKCSTDTCDVLKFTTLYFLMLTRLLFNRYMWCIEIPLYALGAPTLSCSTDTCDVLKFGRCRQRGIQQRCSTDTCDVLKLRITKQGWYLASLFNRYMWCIEIKDNETMLILGFFVQPIHVMYWNDTNLKR